MEGFKDNPKVGSIQVHKLGHSLVYVLPNESDIDYCFTGVELFENDVSGLWLIGCFERNNVYKQSLIKKYMKQIKKFRSEQEEPTQIKD